MPGQLTRRRLMLASAGSALAAAAPSAVAPVSAQILAQTLAQGQDPTKPQAPRFGYEDIVRRARDVASVPFDATPPQLAPAIANLDYDAWRDIRFRPDKAFFQAPEVLFQLQLFHLGFNFKRPVVVNIIRDGTPAPIPYSASLFDFGRTKMDQALAGEYRLCRVPAALPAERAEGDGRARRFPRRELFPLPRARPALRPFGARPRHQCRCRAQRGISVLPRVLGGAAGARCRQGDHLCAARR